jgi:desulfoferrodoxin (superoxide reductase-like protein)
MEHTSTPIKMMEVMRQREMLQRKVVEHRDQHTQKYIPLINVVLCEEVSTIRMSGRSSVSAIKENKKKHAPPRENREL